MWADPQQCVQYAFTACHQWGWEAREKKKRYIYFRNRWTSPGMELNFGHKNANVYARPLCFCVPACAQTCMPSPRHCAQAPPETVAVLMNGELCVLLVQCEEWKFIMGVLRGMVGRAALIIFLPPNVFMHSAHRGKLTLMWILVQRLLMLFGRMQAASSFFFHFLILLLPFLYFYYSLSLFPAVPQTSSAE